MPDSKITELTALTDPALTDVFPLVDLSDTTQDPSGTTKRTTLQDIAELMGGDHTQEVDVVSRVGNAVTPLFTNISTTYTISAGKVDGASVFGVILRAAGTVGSDAREKVLRLTINTATVDLTFNDTTNLDNWYYEAEIIYGGASAQKVIVRAFAGGDAQSGLGHAVKCVDLTEDWTSAMTFTLSANVDQADENDGFRHKKSALGYLAQGSAGAGGGGGSVPPIILNRIPAGTGTTIADGTWEFSGNNLQPVTNLSDIGSIVRRVDTLYLGDTINYGSTIVLSESGTTRLSIASGGAVDIPGTATINGLLVRDPHSGGLNFNVAIGNSNTGAALTGSAERNIAIGNNALQTSTSAIGDIAMGQNALQLSTGTPNIALGNETGSSITTGTQNILIGTAAGLNIDVGTDNIIIGHNSDTWDEAENYSIIIGNDNDNNFASGVHSQIILGHSQGDYTNTSLTNPMVIGGGGLDIDQVVIGRGYQTDTVYGGVRIKPSRMNGIADTAGAPLILQGGGGTGSGDGGDIELQIVPSSGSGSGGNDTQGSSKTVVLRAKGDGNLNLPNLPTSSAGLSAGDVWNNSGVLNIV